MRVLVVFLGTKRLPLLVGLKDDLINVIPVLPKIELIQFLLVVALLVLALQAGKNGGNQFDLACDLAGEVLVELFGKVVKGVIKAELKSA